MIVMVLENPEPDNLVRKGVDIEIRILIKGASDDEAERFGDVLHDLAEELRPQSEPAAFQIDPSEVMA